jgi:F1F0 ATPase subunit 2
MLGAMKMIDLYVLIICFIFGGFMGSLYFSGLWQTVSRLADSPHPIRLLMLSFAVRLGLVLAGFYIIMDGSWARLAAAILGFMIARVFLVEKLGQMQISSCKGAQLWK